MGAKFKAVEQTACGNPAWPAQERGGPGVVWWCPGCDEPHEVPVQPHAHGWAFNGNYDAPTLQPSVIIRESPVQKRCHSIITGGRVFFCVDSGHALASRTVDLPDWHES